MTCQHKWERRDKQPWYLPYCICTECEMELSTSQYEALQQAHREGWEQGKFEVIRAIQSKRHEYRCEAAEASHRNFTELEKTYLARHAATADLFDAISAMEYKEDNND